MGMLNDNRSPLMKRLAEMMPKKPEPPQWDSLPMRIELHPIRMAADSFTAWMGDDLPANQEELRAMLWVFGEILNREMERMLNDAHRRAVDLLGTLPMKPTIFEQVESKMNAYSEAVSGGDSDAMRRLAPEGPTYGDVVKEHRMEEVQRMIDAVNKAREEKS